MINSPHNQFVYTGPVFVPATASPPEGDGVVDFAASSDHSSVINYVVNVYDMLGNIVTSVDVGKPTPIGGVIYVDLTSTFTGLSAGMYYIRAIAMFDYGGDLSEASDAFSLPLA